MYTGSAFLQLSREYGYAAATFAQRRPKIPLERWNDMMDVVDERNITSDVVLNARSRYAASTTRCLQKTRLPGEEHVCW